ncbi:phage distal tail protein domain-containing protein [Enterococcus avium]|uniref:phage distal tail protein domain-containing protein n=1 Tax=Enterococcus avium TaxID=33945 RepID=UPI0028914D96|nr:phage distal tail protein domain-containing protein [Enterococcus avium]MDT2550011.1 phage baseplate protein [Enterococcus avium]
MRTVILRNKVNEEIDLSTEDYFATELTNLGFEVQKEHIGQWGNFREINESIELSEFQSSIMISLHGFREKELYVSLVEFLASGPFELEFAFDEETMIRKCSLKSLSKTEIDSKTALLTDTLELYFTSNWYSVKREKLIQRSAVLNTQGKVYPYMRPYVYTKNVWEKKGIFKFSNNSVFLTNSSERMSPMKIVIKGKCTNPYWEVIQNSQVVASDGYFINMTGTQTLEISSLLEDQTAILKDVGMIESSVYQQQDYTKTNFVQAPLGDFSIVFHVGNADVEIELYEECDLF